MKSWTTVSKTMVIAQRKLLFQSEKCKQATL